MPSTVQTVVIAVAAVAVAGTAIYVTTRPNQATSPAAPMAAPAAAPITAPVAASVAAPGPAASPAPEAAKAPEPPPAPAFVPGNAPETPPPAPQTAASGQAPGQIAIPATTTFKTLSQPYSLTRDSAAYVAATPDAPQLYPLRSGTAVGTVARSADGRWVIALTEDGQAAYLQTADLGPYDPRIAPRPDLPDSVEGIAQAVDTATLTVDGQTVPLAGIKGETGFYAAQLQGMINSQGGRVKCTLQNSAYLCVLPNGMDIARAGLFNGGAELADGASDDYRAQSASAQAAHKGIWH